MPQRILFVCIASGQAGTENATYHSIRLTREAGHKCFVALTTPDQGFGASLDALGVPWEDLRFRKLRPFSAMLSIWLAVLRWRPEVILINGLDLDSILAIGLTRGVQRRVLIAHDDSVFSNSDRDRAALALRFSKRFMDRVLFPSQSTMRSAVDLVPSLSSKATVLYNAVPPPKSTVQREFARELLDLPLGKFIVGFASRLEPGKRVDIAMEAITQNPNMHLAIAGSGSMKVALRQRAKALGIDHRVHWLGWQTSLEAFYTAVDCFMLISDQDAFGLVAAEAMLHRRPVVAAILSGGIRELINRPEHGILLNCHKPDIIAAQLLRIQEGRSKINVSTARDHVLNLCSEATHQEGLLRSLGCSEEASH